MLSSHAKPHVQGSVLFPGDDSFDVERTGFNLAVDHHPAIIVVPESPNDVVSAVRFAADSGLPVAVQATGHGPAIPADGAMLINTRKLTDLVIDADTAMARIGSGLKWEAVIEQAAPLGLAPLVGSTPDVSATGYLTGGGLPILGRQYGLGADHVHAVELVTADGELRRTTAAAHPDLFWAVRGGKGNFGVVTAIETRLQRLDRLYGGILYFPGARAREVMAGWLSWTAGLPDEMSTSFALVRIPDLPGLPKTMRGAFLVHVRVAFTGSAEAGERLVQPLRAMAPDMDTVAEMPYSRIAEIHNDPTEPVPIRDCGTLLRSLDEDAVDRLVALAGPDAVNPPELVEIRLLGGALARAPEIPGAAGHPGAAFTMVLAMITSPDQDDHVGRSMDRVIESLRPWDTGEKMPNFLGRGDIEPNQVRKAYGEDTFRKLAEIKSTWDPTNMFRINHNIPPASTQA